MIMQNGHDVNAHTLHSLDDGICHVKVIGVHHSNVSWYLLLVDIFNSLISAETYHVQRVATSLLYGENRSAS